MQSEIANYANWQMFSLLTNDLVELFRGQDIARQHDPNSPHGLLEIDFFVKIEGTTLSIRFEDIIHPDQVLLRSEGGWYFASHSRGKCCWENDFVSFASSEAGSGMPSNESVRPL